VTTNVTIGTITLDINAAGISPGLAAMLAILHAAPVSLTISRAADQRHAARRDL
jgi:hypothetical protein